MPPHRIHGRIVFVHTSDEMYGADRVLISIYEALLPSERARAEFWLPTDLKHGERPLCRELRRRGAAVRHVDLPVLRRSYRAPHQLCALARRVWALRRAFEDWRPDTVYCTTSAALLAAPVARLSRVPHVVGHVQEIWSMADRRILNVLGRSCHRLLTISEPVAASLGSGLRDRAIVVPNATAYPAEVNSPHRRSGPLTFLVASRWNAWKGHQTLLTAWGLAGCPGRLLVLGGRPPAGEMVDVEALRTSLSNPASVDVIGEVDDVGPYLRDADVMVVPSDQPEPFGLVATEAFAHARPVIASAGGGLLDIVTDAQDGWLYPLRDAHALAELLARLDRPTAAAAGERARQTYLERFTPERFSACWRDANRLPADEGAVATVAPPN